MKHTARSAFDAAGRAALSAGLAILALGTPTTGFAEGAEVTLHQEAIVYRAFYYDQSDKLLHVEIVNSVAGRKLTPLFSAPTVAAPQTPPQEPSAAVLIGSNATYAIYYGIGGPNPTKPAPGATKVPSSPVAMEKLTAADSHRAIECASPGGDVCSFPRMCHCGMVGSCCCY
jgi:hypothetical protein